MENIDKLFEDIKVEKIKENLENLIKEIESKNRKEQNRVLQEIIIKAREKKEEIDKNCKVFKGIYYYPEVIAPFALLINELIVDDEDDEDILESLKFILNNYFKVFKQPKSNDWFVEVKKIENIINILESECEFFSILEKKQIKLDIYSLKYRWRNMEIQLTNYNDIKNNKFAIQLFYSKAEDKKEEYKLEIVLRQFGILLKNILLGSSQMAPSDFIDVYKPVKDFPYIDKESKEYTALFADTFVHYVIEKMEIKITEKLGEGWKENTKERNEEFVKNILQYFDNIFEGLLKEENEEWDDEEACPCGSNKKYKNCCKKKKIKYYKEDENHYTKAIPMHPVVKSVLYNEQIRFKQLFGRTPGNDDYVTSGVLLKDMSRFRKIMKREEVVSKAWLYASEQMDGLMLTEENIDLLPERDVREFKYHIKEYKKLMTSKVRGNKCNIVQATEAINVILENIMSNKIDDMIYVLNLFVNSYSREKSKEKSYIIENIKDFLVFCAYKCSINMTVLKELIEQEYYDTSMAVVRFIYEILTQIRAYKKEPKLFEQKILSIAGLENGKCVRVDRKTIKNVATGEIYHYEIPKRLLSEKAGENFLKIYDTLYRELSEFIHLDAIGAKKIFQENDMFLDIDECLMAGFIGVVFCIEIIMELIEFEGKEERISNDIKYFSNEILKEILDIFPMIIALEEKEEYKILEDTLKEYKTDYKINYQRKNRYQVL